MSTSGTFQMLAKSLRIAMISFFSCHFVIDSHYSSKYGVLDHTPPPKLPFVRPNKHVSWLSQKRHQNITTHTRTAISGRSKRAANTNGYGNYGSRSIKHTTLTLWPKIPVPLQVKWKLLNSAHQYARNKCWHFIFTKYDTVGITGVSTST